MMLCIFGGILLLREVVWENVSEFGLFSNLSLDNV